MAVVVSKGGETRTSRAADWPGPPPVSWRGRGSMGCGVAKGVRAMVDVAAGEFADRIGQPVGFGRLAVAGAI